MTAPLTGFHRRMDSTGLRHTSSRLRGSIHHGAHRPARDEPRHANRYRETVLQRTGRWLARKDSNLQSPDPESGALPFGHSPACRGRRMGRTGRSLDDAVEEGLLPVAGRAFDLEQASFRREAARGGEAGEGAVRRDHPMARDDDRERVPAERRADLARPVRPADGSGDLAVAPRRARGDLPCRRMDGAPEPVDPALVEDDIAQVARRLRRGRRRSPRSRDGPTSVAGVVPASNVGPGRGGRWGRRTRLMPASVHRTAQRPRAVSKVTVEVIGPMPWRTRPTAAAVARSAATHGRPSLSRPSTEPSPRCPGA